MSKRSKGAVASRGCLLMHPDPPSAVYGTLWYSKIRCHHRSTFTIGGVVYTSIFNAVVDQHGMCSIRTQVVIRVSICRQTKSEPRALGMTLKAALSGSLVRHSNPFPPPSGKTVKGE